MAQYRPFSKRRKAPSKGLGLQVFNPPASEGYTRTAVVTVAVGDKYKWMFDITLPSIKAYSDRFGHDYICVDDSWRKRDTHPCDLKQNVWYLLHSNRYDRILYVDADIYIRDNAPDIFECVPEGTLGVYEEGCHWKTTNAELHRDFRDYISHYNETMDKLGFRPVQQQWDNRYYNAGMFVCDKWTCPHIPPAGKVMHLPHRIKISRGGDFYDQHYFNLMRVKHGIPVTELGAEWNRFRNHKNSPVTVDDSYFIHYCANGKDKLADDVAQWDKPIQEKHVTIRRKIKPMSRTLMYTAVSGKQYEDLFKIIEPYHEAYADAHGFDYKVVRDSEYKYPNPAWWSLVGSDFFSEYDCIVYMDCDAMPWYGAPNIVEQVPKDKFGAFNSYTLDYFRPPHSDAYKSMIKWQEQHNCVMQDIPSFYINSGVFVCWTKASCILNHTHMTHVNRYHEQHMINQNLYEHPHLYYELGREWNCGHLNIRNAKEIGHKSHIIHLNGVPVQRRIPFLRAYIDEHKAVQ